MEGDKEAKEWGERHRDVLQDITLVSLRHAVVVGDSVRLFCAW
jgi:hypothetical protein